MQLKVENHRQSDAVVAGLLQRFAGIFVLLETAISALIVVGVFAAASQPVGWSSVMQILLCAGLGLLLWMADSRMNADEFCTVPATSRLPDRRPAGEEA